MEQLLWNANVVAHEGYLVKQGLDRARVDGLILEFGVGEGTSINILAKQTKQTVYGFDSFNGLPEDWDQGSKIIPQGSFKRQKQPKVESNVVLVVGLFSETIPVWKSTHTEPIRFVHVDSDLYSSAKLVLTELDDQFVSGTVIVFDQLSDFEDSRKNYTNWREGEWKALMEWRKEKRRSIKFLMRTHRYQAAILVQ